MFLTSRRSIDTDPSPGPEHPPRTFADRQNATVTTRGIELVRNAPSGYSVLRDLIDLPCAAPLLQAREERDALRSFHVNWNTGVAAACLLDCGAGRRRRNREKSRRFDTEVGQRLWQEIDDGAPTPLDLIRVTDGLTPQCPSSMDVTVFVDHIVLDEQAQAWLEPDSFMQMHYRPEDAAFYGVLSDHCPIRVTLETPKAAIDDRDAEVRRLINEVVERLARIEQLLMQ